MKITKFQGVVPKVRADKLGEGYAAFAENCLLHSGAIVPLRAPRPLNHIVDINGHSYTGAPQSLYHIGGAWLGFDKVTPIAEDPIHVAGVTSFLFVRDNKLWRSGYEWIADKEGPVELGIPRPVAPPTAIPTSTSCREEMELPDDCWRKAVDKTLEPEPPKEGEEPTPPMECPEDNRPPLVLSFCYTWVTACKEESGPSDYSEPVTFPRTEQIMLIPTEKPPANAEKIRWYVLLVGDKDAEMAEIGEQPAAEMAFLFCPDVFAGGNPLITHSWYPVPCADGVANIGYGSAMVWSGRNLYVSAHKQPHAYPEANTLTVDDEIVRVVSFITKTGAYQAVVLTKGVPYIVSGDQPDKLTVTRINRRMPCLSAKGVMLVGESVYYCSDEGVAVVTGAGVGLLTSNWMDKEWWMKHAPAEYCLGYYDQRIFAFTTNENSRSLMFPMKTSDQAYAGSDLVYLSHRPSAVYFGDITTMTIALGDIAFDWEGNDYSMQATWKSAIMSSTEPWSMSACQVLSDAEDVPECYTDWVALVWTEYRRLLTALDANTFIQKYPDAKEALPYLVAPKVALTLTANERVRIDRPVWSERPFRVSGQGLVRRWQLEVVSTAVVNEISLAANMSEL